MKTTYWILVVMLLTRVRAERRLRYADIVQTTESLGKGFRSTRKFLSAVRSD